MWYRGAVDAAEGRRKGLSVRQAGGRDEGSRRPRMRLSLAAGPGCYALPVFPISYLPPSPPLAFFPQLLSSPLSFLSRLPFKP